MTEKGEGFRFEAHEITYNPEDYSGLRRGVFSLRQTLRRVRIALVLAACVFSSPPEQREYPLRDEYPIVNGGSAGPDPLEEPRRIDYPPKNLA